jgi:hypothetical protein
MPRQQNFTSAIGGADDQAADACELHDRRTAMNEQTVVIRSILFARFITQEILFSGKKYMGRA